MNTVETQPARQSGEMTWKRVGPFVGVQFDRVRAFPARTLRIVTHQAYDAFGLIGSELNGVAVLDEDRKVVVTDCMASAASGYHGVSSQAWDLAWELYTADWETVKRIVNSSARLREENEL